MYLARRGAVANADTRSWNSPFLLPGAIRAYEKVGHEWAVMARMRRPKWQSFVWAWLSETLPLTCLSLFDVLKRCQTNLQVRAELIIVDDVAYLPVGFQFVQ